MLGKSYHNFEEAKTVQKLIQFLTEDIKKCEGFGNTTKQRKEPYSKDKFWILSTYYA